MPPTIQLSISEAHNQLRTGHQDIRTYFSETAAPERTMNETLATATTTSTTTTTDRIGLLGTEFQRQLQQHQQPRIHAATTSNNSRRPRYQDIRNFLSGAIGAVTTRATQTTTEETTASSENLISRCRAIRNRLQPPRSQVTQDTTEEPTTPTANVFSSLRALRNRFQHPRSQETQENTEETTNSPVSTFSRIRAMGNQFQQARTQPSTTSTDTWRFFPGRNRPS